MSIVPRIIQAGDSNGGGAELPEVTDILKGDGAGGAEAAVDGTDFISEVSLDTTPQLGGDLDPNGNNIDAGTAAADTAGSDFEITAESGGAHTSNNPAGGNVVLRPGAKGSGGSGSDGRVIIRKPGGTASEVVEISHNGTTVIVKNGTTEFESFHFVNSTHTLAKLLSTGQLVLEGAGNPSIQTGGGRWFFDSNLNMGQNVKFYWTNGNDPWNTIDTSIKRGQAGVVQIFDGAGSAGGCMEFAQVSDVPNPSTNCAIIGTEDVAGTTEVIVADEGGTEVQLTAHRMDGPDWLYDKDELFQQVNFDCQRYAGKVRYRNVVRKDWLDSQGLRMTRITTIPEDATAGDILLSEATEDQKARCCYYQETLDDFMARTSKTKPQRNWEEDQQAKQDKYDAEREQEIIKYMEWEQLRDEEKVGVEAPVIRPVADIRKPRPEILKMHDQALEELRKEEPEEPGVFTRAAKWLGLR